MIKMAQLEPIKKMHYLEGQSVREMRRRNGMGLNGGCGNLSSESKSDVGCDNEVE